jgi:high-affinity Fe2+/Pb2+ permease
MDQGASIWTVLVVALVAANLPYLSPRILLVGPRRDPKAAGWRVLEVVLLALITLAIGFGLESRLGQRSAQGWEFYAASLALFVTLGFPGFVWRYLRRSRSKVREFDDEETA